MFPMNEMMDGKQQEVSGGEVRSTLRHAWRAGIGGAGARPKFAVDIIFPYDQKLQQWKTMYSHARADFREASQFLHDASSSLSLSLDGRDKLVHTPAPPT